MQDPEQSATSQPQQESSVTQKVNAAGSRAGAEIIFRLLNLLRAVAYSGCGVLLISLTAFAISRQFGSFSPTQSWQADLIYLLSSVLLIGLAALMLRLFDGRSPRALGLWFYAGWRREVAQGVGIGGGVLVIVACSLAGAGGMTEFKLAAGVHWLAFLHAAFFILLAATLEELMFRGYAFQRLVDSVGAVGAIAVSSFVFGVVHLSNPNSPGLLSTCNTILAGALLAVAYLKTRGLWLPIALHWAWNFFQGPVLGSRVSGIEITPVLLEWKPGGPAWLSGGSYGLESSAALTVACAAAVVWLQMSRAVRTTPEVLAVSKRAE
jgi:hypothetical protein